MLSGEMVGSVMVWGWGRSFIDWTTTGCSLGTLFCNIPFNFYLILILVSLLLFLSSIYGEVLLLSGKTCNKLNHNCAKARAFH